MFVIGGVYIELGLLEGMIGPDPGSSNLLFARSTNLFWFCSSKPG